MRRCDRIFIVYDFWGVSLKQLRDAFNYVAYHHVPQGIMGVYTERFWVDDDSELQHIQVQYNGKPFINARGNFESANRTVHRFLLSSGKIDHKITRDSTNNF